LGFGIYPESLLYLLFFLSGISGLIYQVVWVRVFGNVFGNTVYSAALVIAVFMLGLGAGSYVAGRWADRRYAGNAELPLRAYGYFEVAIAVLGAAIAVILPHLDRLSVLVTSYRPDSNGWFVITVGSYAARAAIAVALLTPVTLLMGGTLTLLIRHLVRSDVEEQSRRIALLYAVNTAGAAVGCFLTDFSLVPAWGLLRTQMLAVALNVIAGFGAIALGRLQPAPTEGAARQRRGAPAAREWGNRKAHIPSQPRTPNPESRIPNPGLVPLVAFALALSGFAGLGMEIVWFRHFSIMLGAFRAVFSLLLTVILVGIGIGAFAASVLHTRRDPGRLLLVTQSLFVAAVLAGLWAADSSVIDRTVSNAISANASAPSALAEIWFNLRPMLREVALPALLIGFSFPLANVLVQRAELAVGRRAGALYFANTAGAVLGSLAAGFVLLPWLGLQASTTVLVLVAAAGLVPLAIAVGQTNREPRTTTPRSSIPDPRSLVPLTIATASIAAWLMLPADYISTRALPAPEPNEHVLNQTEGVNEIVTITETTGKGRRLMTNGHAMSATWPLSQRYMRALAHVPLLMMENPERVLVIGFGVGNTVAAATLHPSVQRVEVADLSRNVLGHASYFSGSNGNIISDPRVTIFVNDGRHHLLMGERTNVGAGLQTRPYDLITLEPPPIGYAGVASLYSEEFYALARSRLTPHGFVSQWLPSYQVPVDTTLSMIRAFIDVFPQSVLLSGAEADLILIGANDRIQVDPNELFAALSQRPTVRADLARVNLGTPREIVGMFLGSAPKLADATRDAVPVTDDRPVQEYGVRSLLNLGEYVPGSVVDLSDISTWCPKCFENGMPVRVVEGLDLYLKLLARAYAATPAEGLRTRQLADEGRVLAGSAYLGAVVPESADVYNDLGIAYAARGQLDAAILQFRQALRLDPDAAGTHWHLGAALAERGALQEAEEHLRTSVQRDPGNEAARHDLDAVLALRAQR
jgi:spermidine synthase